MRRRQLKDQRRRPRTSDVRSTDAGGRLLVLIATVVVGCGPGDETSTYYRLEEATLTRDGAPETFYVVESYWTSEVGCDVVRVSLSPLTGVYSDGVSFQVAAPSPFRSEETIRFPQALDDPCEGPTYAARAEPYDDPNGLVRTSEGVIVVTLKQDHVRFDFENFTYVHDDDAGTTSSLTGPLRIYRMQDSRGAKRRP